MVFVVRGVSPGIILGNCRGVRPVLSIQFAVYFSVKESKAFLTVFEMISTLVKIKTPFDPNLTVPVSDLVSDGRFVMFTKRFVSQLRLVLQRVASQTAM